MSEFKRGDRVKVEYEATILGREGPIFFLVEHPFFKEPARAHPSTLTKLPDPEPEWRPGDLIRFRTEEGAVPITALRVAGMYWIDTYQGARYSSEISLAWDKGLVTILYKEGS